VAFLFLGNEQQGNEGNKEDSTTISWFGRSAWPGTIFDDDSVAVFRSLCTWFLCCSIVFSVFPRVSKRQLLFRAQTLLVLIKANEFKTPSSS
jgi:hypothetical protein